MEFDIRYTYITDISYLRQWMRLPGMLNFFPMSNDKEIEDAIQCWIGFCRWYSSLTVTVNHTPVAIGTLFLMPYKKVAHHCLFKLIVDPKFQRKGIGSALLKNLKHLARNYFHLEAMNIEIFEGNPIKDLLHKYDFKEIIGQDKFVKEEGKYLPRIVMGADL